MPILKNIDRINTRSLILGLIFLLIVNCIFSCDNGPVSNGGFVSSDKTDSGKVSGTPDENQQVYAMLCLPKNPNPGEPFRILTVSG